MSTTTMNKKMIFCFMFVVTVLLGSCSGTVYNVGDAYGWTAKKKDTYNDWAKGKEFHVGDTLIFEYNRTLNVDVTQVSGALEYQYCDSSSPKAVYNTGHDVLILTEPGYHYFITSNPGRCASGQKLEVLVLLDPSSRPPSPPRNILPLGKIYKVGDYIGWGVYNTEYYYNWAKEKEFFVGDSLFFQYRKEFNDVYEISGEVEFITCDSTSPVEVHKTGHDLVRLTKPGVHYFISSNADHCQDGLKLEVVVREQLEPVAANPNVPRPKIGLSPLDRFRNRWLHPFRPRPGPRHHH